jgi:hypothetical protein
VQVRCGHGGRAELILDAVECRIESGEEPTIATVDGDMKPPGTCDVIDCGPTLSFITG